MINSRKCYWNEWGGKTDLILIVGITLLFICFKGCAIITFQIEKLIKK